jgi:hypothetical protein
MSTDAPESHKDSPIADGGQDNRIDVDEQIALELAREHLAHEFMPWDQTGSGTLANLDQAVSSIRTSLQDGDAPERSDLEVARDSLRKLNERLDEVARLHNMSRWDAGRRYGELTEAEQREIAEAEEENDGGE